jgi:hypothetical protein
MLKWRRPASCVFSIAPLRRDDGGINAVSCQWAAWRISFAFAKKRAAAPLGGSYNSAQKQFGAESIVH